MDCLTSNPKGANYAYNQKPGATLPGNTKITQNSTVDFLLKMTQEANQQSLAQKVIKTVCSSPQHKNPFPKMIPTTIAGPDALIHFLNRLESESPKSPKISTEPDSTDPKDFAQNP
jgi:hypothetical protein